MMNEWMNEKFIIHFYLEKPTQKCGVQTKWQVEKQNKKVIIGNYPIQYLDGAVTMDEDCDRG